VYYAGFDLVRRDAATTIFLSDRKKIKKGRKACIAKARRLGVEVDYSEDFSGFIAVENANLQKKYAVNAVHSAEELTLLHKRFPDNIFLFLAHSEGVLLAGGLIFQTATVAHLQYFCSTEQGESLSAGDLVIEAILKHCVEHNIGIFDFGISTEQQGRYLNAGLLRYKESFGGVTTIADFYKKSFTSNSG
jgi:predicted N-acyltransferase